jgi:MerR family transcriptional regulator, copper efflux regulator
MSLHRKPSSETKAMTVGELAKKAGVTPRTIRYYEEVGLLPQLKRTANGYRTYTEKYLSGVRQIQRAKRLGFSLKEIKELSGIRIQQPENESEMIFRAIEIVKAHLSATHKKMKDIKDHIDLLENEIQRLTDILKNVSGK